MRHTTRIVPLGMKMTQRAIFALALTLVVGFPEAYGAQASASVASMAVGGEDGSQLISNTVIEGLEAGIMKYTNAHRVDMGAPAFSDSSSAGQMAQAFSLTLVKSGIFEHDQPGLTFKQRMDEAKLCGDDCPYTAENIYEIDYPSIQALQNDVQSDDQVDLLAKEIVDGWLNSPAHRRNIEDPLLESMGVGVAVSTNGKLYATQDFIRSTPLTPEQYQKIPNQ